jgi:transcription elongation factor GreA
MSDYPMTPKGYDKLVVELEELKTVERHKVITAIAEAREHGDLKENAEYHAAREKQGFIEGRIMNLSDKLSRVKVINTSETTSKTVTFGAIVTLLDLNDDSEKTYQIVSDYESDISVGLISISSPIARGLLGKAEGEEATLVTPGSTKEYEIISVKYK